MKFSLVFLLFQSFYLFGICQNEHIKTASGEFIFQQFADNIIKITFQPKGYLKNEQVTDAVILKPLSQKATVKQNEPKAEKTILFNSSRLDFHDGKINFSSGKISCIAEVFHQDDFNGFRFKLVAGERIYGGGERAIPLNRRGYKFPLYNNPWYGYSMGADALNYSVPFFTSSNGYGLFFDNASKGYADIGNSSPNVFEAGFSSGELNVFIITGDDNQEILTSYHKLTGTQPLPPRWALGNFMSRFGYSSDAQVKDVLRKMNRAEFPVDAIIFDLFWFGDSIKGTLGNLDWVNKANWPDPKKMISGFAKQKINTILIAEPFILEGTRTFLKAQKFLATDSMGRPYKLTDFYFGKGGLVDIYRKDAGDWIWENHYKKQIANGVTGWWTDLGEPEKHPSNMVHNFSDLGIKRPMKADEVHNVYGHYWNKMLFDHYAKDFPNQRLFHLNRSGFAGSQRYSIFPWSGDVSRSWSGFQAQLPVMLGMSMSGVPYVHADAGGFAGGEGDNELYTRWLQFACFTPIFRPHGTALFELDKSAFSFPSEPALIEEPWRTYAKETVRLRYALLPYNYTLAYNQAAKGEPLVAPLYYYYPNDSLAVNIEDEFMWGANILVAPVLKKGAVERQLYLPGGNWYVLNNPSNKIADTSMYHLTVNVKAPINETPVFVKAGSFIPMIVPSNGRNSKSFTTDSLTIQYYFDKQASQYSFYDDDGNNKHSISDKLFERITFKAIPFGQLISFKISSTGGTFTGKPSKRNIRMLLHGSFDFTKTVYIDGKRYSKIFPVINEDGIPSGSFFFTFDYSGNPITIDIK